MRDRDRWVRASAAEALATLGATREAIPGLVAATRDSDASVRAAAAWSLAHVVLRRGE